MVFSNKVHEPATFVLIRDVTVAGRITYCRCNTSEVEVFSLTEEGEIAFREWLRMQQPDSGQMQKCDRRFF